MNTLGALKHIWGHMAENMEAIRKAINERTVICGDGLSPRETPSGITISLTDKTAEQTASEAQAAVDLSALYARVAALETLLAGSSWLGVDVVDTSCNRSTLTVLQK